MKDRAFRPFTNISAIRLSLTITIILNALTLLGYAYNKSLGGPYPIRLVYAFFCDFGLLYLLYMLNFKTILQKWEKSTKLWTICGGSLIITIVLSMIISNVAIRFFPIVPLSVNFQILTSLFKHLIEYIIVMLSTFLFASVDERQKALLENEKLIVENIRIRYEVLKNQVDPHFLFNSLNTLDGLIGVDDDKAREFVQNISSVFRYAISNKEIMYLEEELDFTEAYANLMKIRYGDNFQIQYNIEEQYRKYYIMPISLQLLVENAIKHNVISNKHSLIITIETTPNDTIRVLNNIQPKQKAEPGTGIGLANLTERYKLLFQKEVSITQTDVFCVEIPLIKQLEPTKIQNEPTNESYYC